jgi:hypothetical protein
MFGSVERARPARGKCLMKMCRCTATFTGSCLNTDIKWAPRLFPAPVVKTKESRVLTPDRSGLGSCPPREENFLIPSTIGNQVAPHVSLTHDAILTAVGPQLAHLMRDKLIEKLVLQRSALLDVQQAAALEVAELEERLEKIHAPLHDRLRAYEKRIVELERELTAKGEENRTITEARISLVKQQLETKRVKTVAQQR